MARHRGFTLIELLVVITIIGILAAIALPNYIKAKDKAKEVQTKSAIKSLQVAIERYAVDQEEYPLFLIGGDHEGWDFWHRKFNEATPDRSRPQNAWVDDPLILGGYLDGYPENPFVDNGAAVIAMTGPVNPPATGYTAGDGDPRFGFRGTTMGNGVENPMVFRNWDGDPHQLIETERTLTTVTGGDPFAKGFGIPDSDPRGMHYAMGGRKQNDQNGNFEGNTSTHWPGNFFYRGFSDRWYGNKGWEFAYPTTFQATDVNRYLLGGYGAYGTEGADVLRLATKDLYDNQVYYRRPPPWTPSDTALRLNYEVDPSVWKGGLPEMAGGGSNGVGPWFPYDRSPDAPNTFIYGAPDSHPDGVVIVLNPGEERNGE
ncbi:MAG: type II secretion system protein [bacterium]